MVSDVTVADERTGRVKKQEVRGFCGN